MGNAVFLVAILIEVIGWFLLTRSSDAAGKLGFVLVIFGVFVGLLGVVHSRLQQIEANKRAGRSR